MSTSYATLKTISASDLLDGRLERLDVRQQVTDKDSETEKCLTDGRNYIWAFIDSDGQVERLVRYGRNAPAKILDAIADAFDTEIVSEYEPQYWGFDTDEEWNAWLEAKAKKDEEAFYAQVVKFLRGERNDIAPGTLGMGWAETAKALVEKDPSLLWPENRDKLLTEMRSMYNRDKAITVTLSPAEIALADMIATHEDDLPRA